MKHTYLRANSYLLGLVCCLLLALSGCKNELSSELLGEKISFQLAFEGSTFHSSRSLNGLQVHYKIADYRGEIVQEIHSDYHPHEATIVIEPLPLGNYTLYVLAYDQALEAEGLRVNESIQQGSDTWFSFEGNQAPVLLQDQLYYTAEAFEVTSEISLRKLVNLRYVLAGVDMARVSSSLYLMNSLKHIELELPEEARFYTGISVDGNYQGEGSAWVGTASFLKNHAYYIMPQRGDEAIQTTFSVTTQDHLGEMYKLELSAPVYYQAAVKEQVSLDFSAHPDAKLGMLYITSDYYDQEDRGLILQDDEHHSVYCDVDQRSFYMNQIVQLNATDDLTLHTRSYSLLPIKGVSIWSSPEKYGERVLLAYYDSIPALCDARFGIAETVEKQSFQLESKARIELSRAEIASLLASELTLESEDPYWEMLQQIRAEWRIYFNLYGADPTQSNGGPAGNWRGIRPVHVREAIAIFTNVAYMLSVPGYPEHLESYQGEVWGNGGPEDIIDVTTIIPSLLSRGYFRIGLTGGVAGLGGGGTFGVWQPVFLEHYFKPYHAGTVFHELGHCIGYSHSSALCSGFWDRTITSAYYVANIHTFPVNSRYILDSINNPNCY